MQYSRPDKRPDKRNTAIKYRASFVRPTVLRFNTVCPWYGFSRTNHIFFTLPPKRFHRLGPSWVVQWSRESSDLEKFLRTSGLSPPTERKVENKLACFPTNFWIRLLRSGGLLTNPKLIKILNHAYWRISALHYKHILIIIWWLSWVMPVL
jgi:hypothetical protein